MFQRNRYRESAFLRNTSGKNMASVCYVLLNIRTLYRTQQFLLDVYFPMKQLKQP
jgi:hypothetical protein